MAAKIIQLNNISLFYDSITFIYSLLIHFELSVCSVFVLFATGFRLALEILPQVGVLIASRPNSLQSFWNG